MTSSDEVKVQIKGFYRPDRSAILSGVAAKWVAWIVDMQDYLNDPRNLGKVEFSFNGNNKELKAITELKPNP